MEHRTKESHVTSAVIVVPPKGRFFMHAPWMGGSSRSWIMDACGIATRPLWVRDKPVEMLPSSSHWEISRTHLDHIIEGALRQYDTVVVHRKIVSKIVCDRRCTNAKGHDCICSCGGRRHRGSETGLRLIGSTTLVGSGSSHWTRMEYARPAPMSWPELLEKAAEILHNDWT